MSKWYEVEDKEDISLGLDKDEVHFYLYSDDWGGVYTSVSLKLLEEFLEENVNTNNKTTS